MTQHESSETLGSDILWANTLFREQKEQVENMRSALMECDKSDPLSVRVTLQNIKTLRIYHQIIRIIRYTEEMDKIEQVLYQAIDSTLDHASDFISSGDRNECFSAMKILVDLQEKLQKSMIDSQKLLDPYLNIKEMTYIEVPAEINAQDDMISGQVIDQNSRKRLREGAQEVLNALVSPSTELVTDNE